MPRSAPPEVQQRRSYRTATRGRALIQLRGAAIPAESLNLSLGGMLVDCGAAVPRQPPVGTPVLVQLELSGSGWLRQRGHVQRCDAGRLAIGFDAVSPDTEDRIEERMLAWLEAEHSPRLLIVDPSAARRHLIAGLLVQAGYCSIEVSTPLAALQQLQRHQLYIAAIAIAETTCQTGRAELVAYLTEAHAGVPLVMIGARAHDAVIAVLEQLDSRAP